MAPQRALLQDLDGTLDDFVGLHIVGSTLLFAGLLFLAQTAGLALAIGLGWPQ